MVKITLEKAYTVHARSLDRNGENDTSSRFSLTLHDPITCANDQYMKCSLISAKIPSTFYQINSNNRKFKVHFNLTDLHFYSNYASIDVINPLKDEDGNDRTSRSQYQRTVEVTITKGNYSIEELLTELKTKLNSACATAHTNETFYTFMRTNPAVAKTVDDTEASEDLADSGIDSADDYHIIVAPHFDTSYDSKLNKVRIFRDDAGGRMMLGKFKFECSGVKLAFALGLEHVTTQLLKQLHITNANVQTTSELSYHYRESSQTEYNDLTVERPTGDENTKHGTALYSPNCVNMYANDTVYLRCHSLPSNSYETLSGGQTNVMAVIPMMSGSASENFYTPSSPVSTVIGSHSVSSLDMSMTDAFGHTIDLNGSEVEFSLLFECFEHGTRDNKPPDPNYSFANTMNAFANVHHGTEQRHPAPHRSIQLQSTKRPSHSSNRTIVSNKNRSTS